MRGAETESATQSASGSKSGDASIRTLEDLLRRYLIMRYHTRPWAAWQLSFVALTVGPGSMDSRAKVNRTLGLVVLLVGSILPGRAQLSKNEPASVSQIQDEIKQHPDSPKLYVALGLAYWDRNDFSHALEAFQHAVKLAPTSAEAHNWLGVATLQRGDLPG